MKLTRLIAVLAFFIATSGYAKQGTSVSYGLGVFDKEGGTSAVKIFSFAYQDELFWLFDKKMELGVWTDSRSDLGRSSSGYVAYSVGLEATEGWFYVHSFWGLALITNTDAYLGSAYQFMQDFGLGFEGVRRIRIGLNYKHISNAGIVQPNRGRDFLQLKLQIPY